MYAANWSGCTASFRNLTACQPADIMSRSKSPPLEINISRGTGLLRLLKLEVEVNRTGVCLLIAFLAFASAGVTAGAQATTAQISGTVKDQSGAVLPGVEITVTQTATGGKRSTITNETGNYVLASLPLGPYMLEAGLPGFKAYVQTGIVLQVESSPTINVVLQVGQPTDQVQVEANASQVETRTTAIGQVVTNQQVAEMPLNGRDAHE